MAIPALRSNSLLFLWSWLTLIRTLLYSWRTKTIPSLSQSEWLVVVSMFQSMSKRKSTIWMYWCMNNSTERKSFFIIEEPMPWRSSWPSLKTSSPIWSLIQPLGSFKEMDLLRFGQSWDQTGASWIHVAGSLSNRMRILPKMNTRSSRWESQ